MDNEEVVGRPRRKSVEASMSAEALAGSRWKVVVGGKRTSVEGGSGWECGSGRRKVPAASAGEERGTRAKLEDRSVDDT